MTRTLRTAVAAVVLLALWLQAAGQPEPTPMPVLPVDTQPSPPPALLQEPVRGPPPVAARPQPAASPKADDSTARIAKLEADLATARADARRARTEVKDSHDRFANERATLAKERDALAVQLETLRAEKSRVEAARDQAQTELAVARAKLESYDGTIREGAPVDTAALQEALRRAQSKVEMTVRAFSALDLETKRLRAQARDAGFATEAGAEPRNFRAELNRTEQALRAAQNELAAERNRSANLARELARARQGFAPAFEEPPPTAPPTRPGTVAGPQPESDAGAQVHTVTEGENLSSISNRYYKTPNRWLDIYNANRDVMRNENHLAPGMKLRIP